MSSAENNKPNEYKVVIIGNSGVGKTHILSRYLYDVFDKDEKSTVSATYSKKKVKTKKNKEITLQLWDTAGQEVYKGLTKLFYKNATGIIIVYDVTNRNSFEEIKNFWYNEVKLNAPDNVKIVIVGNKCDLYLKEEIKEDEARTYAENIGVMFQLTSALDSSGVDELFQNLADALDDPGFIVANNENNIKLNNDVRNVRNVRRANRRNCC